MLGVGIKNAILLFLIIMILHFLIRNVLLEKSSRKEHFDKPVKESKDTTTAPENVENFMADIDNLKPKTMDKTNELLEFVMGGESTFHESFLEPNDADFKQELPVACDARRILDDVKEAPKKKKNRKDPQQHNNFLVIHEYEEENTLNGGKLFGGNLTGFDSFDTGFQSYSCGAPL